MTPTQALVGWLLVNVALAAFVADLNAARERLEPHRSIPPHVYAEVAA